MELKLTLGFACCCCHNKITATLACKGVGLNDKEGECVAAVNVPCPSCGQVCQLLFEPQAGKVRGVRPYVASQPIPEPSRN